MIIICNIVRIWDPCDSVNNFPSYNIEVYLGKYLKIIKIRRLTTRNNGDLLEKLTVE